MHVLRCLNAIFDNFLTSKQKKIKHPMMFFSMMLYYSTLCFTL